jgi:hypothetical protein
MVGMKMGETTKWSNIAFGRMPLKLPTTSMPNVNLTTINGHLSSSSSDHQRYRTELSLNIADYSYISKRSVSLSFEYFFWQDKNDLYVKDKTSTIDNIIIVFTRRVCYDIFGEIKLSPMANSRKNRSIIVIYCPIW